MRSGSSQPTYLRQSSSGDDGHIRQWYNQHGQMLTLKKAGAATVIMAFAVAVLYGSVCSTLCAAGICPNELQHSSSSDDCDQMPMRHSDYPQKHVPENHDCSMHHHPSVNIVKADNLPQFQLASMGRINAHDLLADSTRVMALSVAAFSLSDLAPPPTLRNTLHQQTSVLRI